MRLEKIKIQNFRNISALEFEPSKVLNFFVGDNAQGKTSIIEAAFFLSTLRSFRTQKNQNLVQFGKDTSQVEARVLVENPNSVLNFKVRLQNEKRTLTVNDKTTTAQKFVAQLKTVVFCPESLAAIKYGPDLRRDLIDQALFQVSGMAREADGHFRRALRQRNACLKQIKMGLLPIRKGREILESLMPGYLRAASEVTFQRLKFLDEMAPLIEKCLGDITGEPCRVGISYESHETTWHERHLDAVLGRLNAEISDPGRRAAEESLGVTLTGPHRHDVGFLFNENDSRIYCSQGQQRALVLSFKIAEIVYHRRAFNSYPLLLLDDVLSELDEKKRRFLIDFLRTSEAQTFLTTTDHAQVLDGASVFKVEAGNFA